MGNTEGVEKVRGNGAWCLNLTDVFMVTRSKPGIEVVGQQAHETLGMST
jgi:hypothetical protein